MVNILVKKMEMMDKKDNDAIWSDRIYKHIVLHQFNQKQIVSSEMQYLLKVKEIK